MTYKSTSRRDFLKLAGLCAASFSLSGCASSTAAKPKLLQKPNIMFIFSDDHTYEAIRAFGSEVETPNLDKLVKNGTTFTHAYNQGSWSGAVCVASRTMLNTGRFLWNASNVFKKLDQEAAAGRFWSQYMQQAGYDTYFSGKWHIKTDVTKLFDVTKNVRGGMPKQTPEGYNRPIEGQPDPWSPYDPKFGGHWEGGKHWSEVLGDDTAEFLAQAAKKTDPFFMYLAFNAPHDPRQSPKEYVDKYPHEKIKVPENFMPEYPYKDAIGCGKELRDERLAPFPRTKYSVQVNRQEYYAIITHMDAQIGRMLDSLKANGLEDSTYIFFTGDHGLAVGHHGLIGKQNMYDHSVRVPLMVTGPGIPKNKKISHPVYLQDIMPTTLQLAGVEQPDHVQFNSLLPAIQGEKTKPYDAIYGGYLKLQRMITYDGYKLILYPEIQRARLFNIKKDPQEINDLAGKKKYEPVMKKLFARFLKLQQETGDPLDLKNVYANLLDN